MSKESPSTSNTKKRQASQTKEVEPKEIDNDCTICCQTYTKQKRMKITCSYCNENCCMECLQKYFLTQADAHCIHCKKIFPSSFLTERFSKSFLREKLQNHYVDIVWN